MSKLPRIQREIMFTHLAYLAIMAVLAVVVSPKIIELYMRRSLPDGTLSLSNDVVLSDREGNAVGVLYKGARLVLPDLDDVSDTDPSDNLRFKLLLDIDVATLKASEETKTRALIVYDAAQPKGPIRSLSGSSFSQSPQ
jgi:hypothetical protein